MARRGTHPCCSRANRETTNPGPLPQPNGVPSGNPDSAQVRGAVRQRRPTWTKRCCSLRRITRFPRFCEWAAKAVAGSGSAPGSTRGHRHRHSRRHAREPSGARAGLIERGADARYLDTGHIVYAIGAARARALTSARESCTRGPMLRSLAMRAFRERLSAAAANPVWSLGARTRLLNRATGIAGRFAPQILANVDVLYLAGTAGRASQKLFWHDELFTLYLARLPRMSDVRAALLAGADGTPPLFYVLTRGSVALFGDGLIALRVPSMLGFLVATVCLYVFVSRRSGRVFGVFASVLPIASATYIYAYEARPYGIVLGCVGVAMVSWQAAAAGVRRAAAVPVLFASLAVAIAVHYWAVLLLIPLGVGELCRSWQRRSLDWPVWCALVGAVSPLIVFRSLIRAATVAVTNPFSQVSSRLVTEQSETVLASLAVPAIVAIVLLVIVGAAVRLDRSVADDGIDVEAPPVCEWLAMAALVALPVFGAAVGKFVTGALMPRYTLPWILGFSVLAAYTAAMSRHARIVGPVLMVVFVAWVAAKETASARLLTYAPPTITATNATVLADRSGTLPIVVTNAHVYLPLVEYAPPELVRRLVVLTPPARVDAVFGVPLGEIGLNVLATWMPLNIQDFDAFVLTNRRFLLYGPSSWMPDELLAAGAHLELRGEDHLAVPFAMSAPDCVFLYDVSFD